MIENNYQVQTCQNCWDTYIKDHCPSCFPSTLSVKIRYSILFALALVGFILLAFVLFGCTATIDTAGQLQTLDNTIKNTYPSATSQPLSGDSYAQLIQKLITEGEHRQWSEDIFISHFENLMGNREESHKVSYVSGWFNSETKRIMRLDFIYETWVLEDGVFTVIREIGKEYNGDGFLDVYECGIVIEDTEGRVIELKDMECDKARIDSLAKDMLVFAMAKAKEMKL